MIYEYVCENVPMNMRAKYIHLKVNCKSECMYVYKRARKIYGLYGPSYNRLEIYKNLCKSAHNLTSGFVTLKLQTDQKIVIC